MLVNKLAHLINGSNAVQIALALRVTPGKEAMAAEQNTITSGGLFDGLFQLERQFKTGTLPGKPHDVTAVSAIEFFELLLSVRARCDRDGPVWMQVIHMRKRNKRV